MSVERVKPPPAAQSTSEPKIIDLGNWRERAIAFEHAIGQVIVGQNRALRLMAIAVFARGHLLLEGDVGVGKTTLLRAAARAMGGPYERVEGTIDLMPADFIYHTYLAEDGRPRVEPGPVLRHGSELAVFFFNEINRARPQVHSLLLRLMAERSVSAFNREYPLPHLQVFADRNRLEREETFELPAAARDRFLMEIEIEAPRDLETRRQLAFDQRFHDADLLIASVPEGIFDYRQLDAVARAIQAEVRSSAALERYVLDLWLALRYPQSAGIAIDGVDMDRFIQGGVSPRGISYLLRASRVVAWLAGRSMILPEDLREIFVEVMAHRIFLDPVYELRRDALVNELCQSLFETVPAPSDGA